MMHGDRASFLYIHTRPPYCATACCTFTLTPRDPLLSPLLDMAQEAALAFWRVVHAISTCSIRSNDLSARSDHCAGVGEGVRS
jgi:hypothetical protein